MRKKGGRDRHAMDDFSDFQEINRRTRKKGREHEFFCVENSPPQGKFRLQQNSHHCSSGSTCDLLGLCLGLRLRL